MVSAAQQTLWFAAAIFVGGLDILIYVMLRAVARQVKTRAFTIAADLLFFLVVAVFEFIFITQLPFNALRWFHLVGHIIGAVIIWFELAPFLFRITNKMVFVFCRCGSFDFLYFQPKQEQKHTKR